MSYKNDLHKDMTELLRTNGGMFPEEIAKFLEKTPEYILGMAYDARKYNVIDDFITLKGLGSDLCIICGDQNKSENNDILSIRIPDSILSASRLDKSLEEGIRGHVECYRSKGLFFHPTRSLKCDDCDYISIYEDEAKGTLTEKCLLLDIRYNGEKAVLSKKACCNHYQPDIDILEPRSLKYGKKKMAWEEAKLEMKQKTFEGYKALMQILEHERLISPLRVVKDQ